jgi:hypothetical protein
MLKDKAIQKRPLESLFVKEPDNQLPHDRTAVDALAAGPSDLGVNTAVEALQQADRDSKVDGGGRFLRRTAYGAFPRFFLAHGYPSRDEIQVTE